jgi:NACHT domain- and WD repeat-containing protein
VWTAPTAPGSCRSGARLRMKIFVSSTFSDFHPERDALQTRVFPELRRHCLARGARFQAVDLRWGVSEEAAAQHQTSRICLNEIERCRTLSPRPNFIALVGDRYGWCPLPDEIPANEFERILQHLSSDSDQRTPSALHLGDWYKKDENALPAVYTFVSRPAVGASRPEWEQTERDLRGILTRAAKQLSFPSRAAVKFTASLTEQEITAAVFDVADASEHVFCFFRTIRAAQGHTDVSAFVDVTAGGQPDTHAGMQLRRLKGRLHLRLSDNIKHYEAAWTGGGITTDHLDQLCRDVHDSLVQIIDAQLAQQHETDALDQGKAAHDAFGRERTQFFVGRSGILQSIDAYLQDSVGRPLIIQGASGSGKSALMARAVEHTRATRPNAAVISRFLGVALRDLGTVPRSGSRVRCSWMS